VLGDKDTERGRVVEWMLASLAIGTVIASRKRR
jgi:hypothetical protein